MLSCPSEQKKTAFSCRGVTQKFGRRVVLDNLSLDVYAGEFVSLLGPSGCGKTTTLRVIAGLERAQSGSVLIWGQEVAGPNIFRPPEDRSVGFVFQDFALFPHLGVFENVAFGLFRLSVHERKERVMETLAQVGLSDYATAYPHTLSGGQQQRIALARAIAPRPDIVLLDEPFSGLDGGLRHQVREETRRILKDLGLTTLMVTHDPQEALLLSDRIAVMRAGIVIQSGTPTELYQAPADPFVARFFGELCQIRVPCVGGVAQTPFGPFCARAALADRAVENFTGEVEFCIRQDAVGFAPEGQGGCATVVRSRMVGQSGLVDLRFQCGKTIRACLPSESLPCEGSSVHMTCDPKQSFIFPVRSSA